jgi:hypothetical protein
MCLCDEVAEHGEGEVGQVGAGNAGDVEPELGRQSAAPVVEEDGMASGSGVPVGWRRQAMSSGLPPLVRRAYELPCTPPDVRGSPPPATP